jgi:hypothetical protein
VEVEVRVNGKERSVRAGVVWFKDVWGKGRKMR